MFRVRACMLSATKWLMVIIVAAAHTVGVGWIAVRSGYRVSPFEAGDVGLMLLLWVYVGLVLKAAVPVLLFVAGGLVLPLVAFVVGLVAAVNAERARGPGEPLGVIYLNLWPAYIVVFLIVGGIEYGFRSGAMRSILLG